MKGKGKSKVKGKGKSEGKGKKGTRLISINCHFGCQFGGKKYEKIWCGEI